jgi:hypothetical protein
MVVTVVGVVLEAVAATSGTSCRVVAVAFLVTILDEGPAFLVVSTCPAVVEQDVPLMVVASL